METNVTEKRKKVLVSRIHLDSTIIDLLYYSSGAMLFHIRTVMSWPAWLAALRLTI